MAVSRAEHQNTIRFIYRTSQSHLVEQELVTIIQL